MTATTAELLRILRERQRQTAKWGDQSLPNVGATYPGRDVQAMACREARDTCDAAHAEGTLSWYDVLLEEVEEAFEAAPDGGEALATELTQVAAVCVAWAEDLRRKDVSIGT